MVWLFKYIVKISYFDRRGRKEARRIGLGRMGLERKRGPEGRGLGPMMKKGRFHQWKDGPSSIGRGVRRCKATG
jgi:hypothetical protein